LSTRAFPWRTALFISLALNLLVIGAVVGGAVAGIRLERTSAHDWHDRRGHGRGGFLATLPEAERSAVRRSLRESFLQSQPERFEARRLREEVRNLAGADTYDAAAVQAALGRMRLADVALLNKFDGAVAEMLTHLSPEQRRDAIEAFSRERFAATRRVLERRRGRSEGDEGR